PSPSMAQDGPGSASHTPHLTSSASFRYAKTAAFSLVWHSVGCHGRCASPRDRVRHGCRTRAYRDVFTACPVVMHSAHGLPNEQQVTPNEQRADVPHVCGFVVRR